MAKVEKKPTLGLRVSAFIQRRLDALLKDVKEANELVSASQAKLPPDVVAKLVFVLELKQPSYRDGIIIQLSYGIVSRERLDLTKRAEGGRGVAQRLGSLLAARHIKGVMDAYQNIAKNTDEMCRGNQPEFDNILRWANKATLKERKAALDYVVASVSLTARPVASMPDIDRGKLTFYRVVKLFDSLRKVPSGGAHEQFTVAACLSALVDEFGMGGPGGLRVETKRINASDASSKTPGDIQLLRANRIEEAFEVSANNWSEKTEMAKRSLRDADLQRIHIIASVGTNMIVEADFLNDFELDLSIIDVDSLVRTLIAVMRKPAREAAIVRLYELLDRYQPDVDRVNAYVNLLKQHKLVA